MEAFGWPFMPRNPSNMLLALKISVTFSGNTGLATRTTSERFLSASLDPKAFQTPTKPLDVGSTN